MAFFNKPTFTGNEPRYVLDAMKSGKISGDGEYTLKCHRWFEEYFSCKKALLTPSCTAALEMAALLIDIKPGDEVIMPSYTFVSTANAFVLRGAKVVFVDIRPDTMNIDERLIESAITSRTVAIVPVHYGGVSCDMEAIVKIAKKNHLYIVEDAAQAMMARYRNRPVGSMGHLAAFSFHETKNFTSGGEGGLLVINDERFVHRAEIVREKGTNRSQFFRGMVDKYTWVDVGSSYLPSEIQAAYLWGQLESANEVTENRLVTWNRYYEQLIENGAALNVRLPIIPLECQHNGHMFFIKCKDLVERTAMLAFLKTHGIHAVFHYVPLHSSPGGTKFGRMHGSDEFTTKESERIVRLPFWYNMEKELCRRVSDTICKFYS